MADSIVHDHIKLISIFSLFSETSHGFTHMQTTTKDGLRFSTAKAFLRPALRRKNLHILINAHVTKILLRNSADYS